MAKQKSITKKKYKLRASGGHILSNVDIQVVGETLEAIKEDSGKLTPELVVNEAKPKNSILHEIFEWDDTVAGQKFRLQQARDVVSSVVEEIMVDGEAIEQRSFLAVQDVDLGNIYVTREEAISDVSYRKQLLDKMVSTLENITVTMKLFRNQDYN